MSFITWDNDPDCRQSLDDIDTAYGCPYELSNGYKMDQWAVMTKSEVENRWGFYGPQDRPGSTEEGVSSDEMMSNLMGTPTILDDRPDDWMPEEEV